MIQPSCTSRRLIRVLDVEPALFADISDGKRKGLGPQLTALCNWSTRAHGVVQRQARTASAFC